MNYSKAEDIESWIKVNDFIEISNLGNIKSTI